MAKMKITFDGFATLAEKIDRAGGNVKRAVDEALQATQNVIQGHLRDAAAPYAKKGGGRRGYATGRMYESILSDQKPEWVGDEASIGVGFDLSTPGGIHSIFVMYGTPRMAKDPAVYNAIRGKATQDEIAEKQEEILRKHLSER